MTSNGLEAMPTTNEEGEEERGSPGKAEQIDRSCREDCGGRLCGETLIICPGGDNSSQSNSNSPAKSAGAESGSGEEQLEDFGERRVTRRRRGRSCTDERTQIIGERIASLSRFGKLNLALGERSLWIDVKYYIGLSGGRKENPYWQTLNSSSR